MAAVLGTGTAGALHHRTERRRAVRCSRSRTGGAPHGVRRRRGSAAARRSDTPAPPTGPGVTGTPGLHSGIHGNGIGGLRPDAHRGHGHRHQHCRAASASCWPRRCGCLPPTSRTTSVSRSRPRFARRRRPRQAALERELGGPCSRHSLLRVPDRRRTGRAPRQHTRRRRPRPPRTPDPVPDGPLPAHPVQLALHTSSRLHPDVPAHGYVRQTVRGPLDTRLLGRALAALADRHTMLRIRIENSAGTDGGTGSASPVQYVAPPSDLSTWYEVRELPWSYRGARNDPVQPAVRSLRRASRARGPRAGERGAVPSGAGDPPRGR